MIPEKAKSRSVLVDAVDEQVIPLLTTRGFRDLEIAKESIPMRHLHRPRSDGGYDAISVIFDKKRRPLFYGVINVIGADGVRQPWGEFIAASDAPAFSPLTRVLIQKRRQGVLPTLLPRWFCYGWFGFRAQESAEINRTEALRACREFAECLEQAERWWATKQLGPNLVSQNIEMPRVITRHKQCS